MGKMSKEEHEAFVHRKIINRMQEIDSLSPEMRELVHEYGYYIVHNFMQHNITKPRQIRHLVEMVLDEFSPTRGSFSIQGKRTEVVEHLKDMEEEE